MREFIVLPLWTNRRDLVAVRVEKALRGEAAHLAHRARSHEVADVDAPGGEQVVVPVTALLSFITSSSHSPKSSKCLTSNNSFSAASKYSSATPQG